jgi:hypothetical protein
MISHYVSFFIQYDVYNIQLIMLESVSLLKDKFYCQHVFEIKFYCQHVFFRSWALHHPRP